MRRTQAGVMLIEALIGILIFSIGILALIGMQGVAIKNTTDARYRSEAAFLATQLIGQMWVDIDNLGSYDSDVTSYTPRDTWLQTVEQTLPGVDIGNATLVPAIEVNAVNGAVTVTIWWKVPGEQDTRRFQMVNRVVGAT